MRAQVIVFNFINVKQKKSEEQPLIQLADIFAGFTCFSREKADEFARYKKEKERYLQPSLFSDTQEEEIRQTLKNRFELIEIIKDRCKKSVNLDTNNYLKTYDPSQPVNFGNYEPQGNYDKAPTKQKY